MKASKLSSNQLFPRHKEDLALRERPIREQWEARGPGLLHQFKRRTADELLVDEATVISVHPALGGGGEPHLQQNAVRFEAVLANPFAATAGVCSPRLAAHAAQLRSADVQRTHSPGSFAGVWFAWRSCRRSWQRHREVEAAPPGDDAILTAIDAWRITVPDGVEILPLLTQWWATYEQGRPHWTVALTALDRMLG